MESVKIKKKASCFSAKAMTNRMVKNTFRLVKVFKKGEEKWKQN